jgi:predicted permease
MDRHAGPLVLVAVIYEVIGIATAWLIKQMFWVPHRFRFGILVAGGWGNYGDIPTSVIMSITGAAPFTATSDQTLSVAYMSAFILVFFVSRVDLIC